MGLLRAAYEDLPQPPQQSKGLSRGPMRAHKAGRQPGARFGSQIKTQAGRGFPLAAFSQFSINCLILRRTNDNADEAKCLSALVLCW